ncbi:ZP3 protein, partial [Halcyon senegalensis]|nr:ZP3 protein [Halcyon senegalensis]
SATSRRPGGRWLVPDPSPSPWTVTTPGKWGTHPPTQEPVCVRVVSPSPLGVALWCRTGSVSSRAVQPTWVPFHSTVAHRRRLRFALDVYDSSWSSRLRQPLGYSPGELINVEASVGADPPLPLRLLVDECGATPSGVPRLSSKVIADHG